MEYIHQGFAIYIKLFFLLTPFFVLGTFISLTQGSDRGLKTKLAIRIALGAASVTLAIFFAGSWIMKLFGITVDAFRAGSGVLLLLTAISLVLGKTDEAREIKPEKLMDMAIVPLAVPITAGPATLGALMVMGTTAPNVYIRLITGLAIVMACASIGIMLVTSDRINKLLGHSNISILSKITGLVLSAIALQMIVVGAKNLWNMQ